MAWLLGLLLLLPSLVSAAWLRYDLASLNIVGAAEDQTNATQDGFGVIEIPGTTVAGINWPEPTNCPDGAGHMGWTRLSAGPALPLILRVLPVEKAYFGCALVGRKKEVYDEVLRLFSLAAVDYMGEGDAMAVLAVNEADRRCPPTDNSSNCPEIKAGATEIAKLFRGKGQLRTLMEYGADLKLQGDALVASKGW